MHLRPRMLFVVAATLAMAAAPSSFAAAAVGAAAPSDFDGDGRADLAIGVPGEISPAHGTRAWSTSCTAPRAA